MNVYHVEKMKPDSHFPCVLIYVLCTGVHQGIQSQTTVGSMCPRISDLEPNAFSDHISVHFWLDELQVHCYLNNELFTHITLDMTIKCSPYITFYIIK